MEKEKNDKKEVGKCNFQTGGKKLLKLSLRLFLPWLVRCLVSTFLDKIVKR